MESNIKIFYDFEFLEGTQKKYFCGIPLWETEPTIEMISLGMVIDNGKSQYREYLINKEFNIDEAWYRHDFITEFVDGLGRGYKNYWIRDNVLRQIWLELEYKDFTINFPDEYISKKQFEDFLPKHTYYTKRRTKYLIGKYGKSRDEIRQLLIDNTAQYDNVNLIGYCGAFDHVLMSWIFGKMVDLPNNFNKWSLDLEQEQERFLQRFRDVNMYLKNRNGSMPLKNVLVYVKENTPYPKQDPSSIHHALSDAIWISKLYNYLNNENSKLDNYVQGS